MFAHSKQMMMGAVAALMLLAANSAPANAIAFNIQWTGANSFSLEGMFSYDDSLIGTGAIDETDLDTFMIEAFLGAIPIGTWDWNAEGVAPGASFNFNFDTTSETFLVGGISTGPNGQLWNTTPTTDSCFNPGIGFRSGLLNQGLCRNGSAVLLSLTPTVQGNPSASRKVSEPGSLALIGVGLAGLGFFRRRTAG